MVRTFFHLSFWRWDFKSITLSGCPIHGLWLLELHQFRNYKMTQLQSIENHVTIAMLKKTTLN